MISLMISSDYLLIVAHPQGKTIPPPITCPLPHQVKLAIDAKFSGCNVYLFLGGETPTPIGASNTTSMGGNVSIPGNLSMLT